MLTTGSQPMADVNFQPLNSVTTLLWNHTISPSVLNQARSNVTRYAFNQVLSNRSQVNWGIPRIEIEAFPFGRMDIGAPQSPNEPGVQAENTIAVNDTLNQVWGNKAFKYGGEIIKEQSNNNLIGGARPDIVFHYLWNLANDAPIFEGINADPNGNFSSSSAVGDVDLTLNQKSPARATTAISLAGNLNLNQQITQTSPTTASQPHQMSITVYDTAGQAHNLVMTFSQVFTGTPPASCHVLMACTWHQTCPLSSTAPRA